MESLSFQYTISPNPDIEIGFTEGGSHAWFFRYYDVDKNNPKRATFRATLGFDALDTRIINEGFFSAIVHRRIANILGMGFVSKTNPNSISVKGSLEDLFQATKGNSLKNEESRYWPSNYEIGLMRALYGESTCLSTFGKTFDEEKVQQAQAREELEAARKLFEEAKAKADAEAKAKADAEAKAKADAEAKAKAGFAKSSTIVCLKGKVIKRITAIKPKCPYGFRKK
jgi:hypothetical protein